MCTSCIIGHCGKALTWASSAMTGERDDEDDKEVDGRRRSSGGSGFESGGWRRERGGGEVVDVLGSIKLKSKVRVQKRSGPRGHLAFARLVGFLAANQMHDCRARPK